MNYLHSVLKKPIEEIFSERKNCELDPTRIDSSKRGTVDFSQVNNPISRTRFEINCNCFNHPISEQNKKNFSGYLKKIVNAILHSIEDCPAPIREVFSHAQAEVIRKYFFSFFLSFFLFSFFFHLLSFF